MGLISKINVLAVEHSVMSPFGLWLQTLIHIATFNLCVTLFFANQAYSLLMFILFQFHMINLNLRKAVLKMNETDLLIFVRVG